jgi:hypothetical protein
MKTYAPPFAALVLVLMLAGPTIHAAPVATAHPAIAYHTLSTTAGPPRTSHGAFGASIRSLVSGLDRSAAAAAAAAAAISPDDDDDDDDDTDWRSWHSQWKRQQQERRCNLWDVCVRVYNVGGESRGYWE